MWAVKKNTHLASLFTGAILESIHALCLHTPPPPPRCQALPAIRCQRRWATGQCPACSSCPEPPKHDDHPIPPAPPPSPKAPSWHTWCPVCLPASPVGPRIAASTRLLRTAKAVLAAAAAAGTAWLSHATALQQLHLISRRACTVHNTP
jgi:hypothetical protein